MGRPGDPPVLEERRYIIRERNRAGGFDNPSRREYRVKGVDEEDAMARLLALCSDRSNSHPQLRVGVEDYEVLEASTGLSRVL